MLSQDRFYIHNDVIDSSKVMHDESFTGCFNEEVSEVAASYILSGRKCDIKSPDRVLPDGTREYKTFYGGERIVLCKA